MRVRKEALVVTLSEPTQPVAEEVSSENPTKFGETGGTGRSLVMSMIAAMASGSARTGERRRRQESRRVERKEEVMMTEERSMAGPRLQVIVKLCRG